MLKIDKCIVVEGKYDKIKLENIIDATIITTNGFRIFKDKKKIELLKILADKKGLLIITDSDSAGNMIRNHLKGVIENDRIVNVYMPQIEGKERRKSKKSSEGYLGLEGIEDSVILEAIKKFGAVDSDKKGRKIQKADLFALGLSGKEESSRLRKEFLRHENLPENLSSNLFLDVINTLFTYESFLERVQIWKQEQAKN